MGGRHRHRSRMDPSGRAIPWSREAGGWRCPPSAPAHQGGGRSGGGVSTAIGPGQRHPLPQTGRAMPPLAGAAEAHSRNPPLMPTRQYQLPFPMGAEENEEDKEAPATSQVLSEYQVKVESLKVSTEHKQASVGRTTGLLPVVHLLPEQGGPHQFSGPQPVGWYGNLNSGSVRPGTVAGIHPSPPSRRPKSLALPPLGRHYPHHLNTCGNGGGIRWGNMDSRFRENDEVGTRTDLSW